MSNLIAPAVYNFENDKSLYAQELSTSQLGIVGTANKGSLNTLILISSQEQFLKTLGEPTTQAGRVAWSYLKAGDQLRFVRVASGDAEEADAVLLDASDDPTLNIIALSKGEWANGIIVQVSAGTTEGSKIDIIDSKTGYLLESFDNVLKANFATALEGSEYVVLTDADPANTNEPKPAVYTLSGGNNGENTDDADYIGTFLNDVATGLQIFRNKELANIDILVTPAESSMPVIVEGIDVVKSRGEAIYLVDPPFGLSTLEVIDWHNGTGTWTGLHQALNSDFACLQWTWQQVYDPYTKQKEWVPPTYAMVRIMVESDNNAGVAAAPAGYERGRAVDALSVEYSPTLGQRKDLYGGDNAVNSFINDPSDGIVLMGQKTLLRKSSALNRINVRRLLNSMKKTLTNVLKYIEFEPHNAKTWRRYENLAKSVLDPHLANGDIYEYRVICDATNNTDSKIDNNILVGDIFFKPTKTAEIIQLNWNLLSTGAEFTEFI